MKTKILTALLLSSVAFANTANATLVTSDTFINSSVVDFSDQATQYNVIGPVQIGNLVGEDITATSSSGNNGLYFNYNGWGLCGNGNWGNGKTYVGLNNNADTMIFSFNDGPVAEVGGFMNYAKGCGPDPFVITALDINMNILESYDLINLADINTPGGSNDGDFRGISLATNGIYYFQLSGGMANVLDELTFTRATDAPEPAPLALLGLGLLGLGLARRRRG